MITTFQETQTALISHCSVEHCTNDMKIKGMCQKHYLRWKKYGDTSHVGTRGRKKEQETCSMEGCMSQQQITKGLCAKHYQRWLKFGDASIIHARGRKAKEHQICHIPHCDHEATAKNMCPKHYQRTRKYGDPLFVGKTRKGKLSEEHVIQILNLYFKENETQMELAGKFGVSQRTISKIIRGTIYTELWEQHIGEELKAKLNKPTVCTAEGCHSEDRIVKGLCFKHYQRVRKYGDPMCVHRRKSKLDEQDMEKIKVLYHEQGMKQAEIASLFNIHQSYVSHVIREPQKTA